MRKLLITENHGLFVVETSVGTRGTGATLRSAAAKLLPAPIDAEQLATGDILVAVYLAIPQVESSNISHDVAGS